MKSVKRTVEGGCEISTLSVVRVAEFVVNASLPSPKYIGAGLLSAVRSRGLDPRYVFVQSLEPIFFPTV